MAEIAVWEVKIGQRTEGVRVVAPTDASFDEIGRAAHIALLDRDLAHVRPEHAEHDENFWRTSASRMQIASITRCAETYTLHPRVVIPLGPLSPAQDPDGQTADSSPAAEPSTNLERAA